MAGTGGPVLSAVPATRTLRGGGQPSPRSPRGREPLGRDPEQEEVPSNSRPLPGAFLIPPALPVVADSSGLPSAASMLATSMEFCSTAEGVIVWITGLGPHDATVVIAARRPKAS